MDSLAELGPAQPQLFFTFYILICLFSLSVIMLFVVTIVNCQLSIVFQPIKVVFDVVVVIVVVVASHRKEQGGT